MQAVLDRTAGVIGTFAGYTGGTTANPTYGDVCAGRTGHTEAVLVRYDPRIVTYEALLDIFWQNHDAGACRKPQYKSAIFYTSPGQRRAARESKRGREAKGHAPATEILPAGIFYVAEDYHQHYYGR